MNMTNHHTTILKCFKMLFAPFLHFCSHLAMVKPLLRLRINSGGNITGMDGPTHTRNAIRKHLDTYCMSHSSPNTPLIHGYQRNSVKSQYKR